ncbi:MAG: ribosomal subunit interface protein [Chloroflexota bacterium]|jgi:putative sigma-54 modulation protein|nr:MAG: ribosomal subunit interface protein [Chloroflexota bacterium]
MDVTIHSNNIRMTDALEAYTRKKLDKLDRYLPNITRIEIDLSQQRSRRGEDLAIAQITIRHKRGAILRAEERVPGDIQTAINAAVDNMYRRIQRFKGKRQRKGRERFTATLEELSVAEAIPDVEEFVEEEIPVEAPAAEAAPTTGIVRRKAISVTAMTEAEAIEQMELLGHTFFVFFNDGTGGVNVLYKRSSGGYGVLVPQVE